MVDRPDERTLTAELDGVRFLCGVTEGRWSVLEYRFPDLFVRVTAHQGAITYQEDFHLVCDGYPDPGPFVEAWSMPTGARASSPEPCSPGYRDALKYWPISGDQHGGIYRAWQRHAATHNEWAAKRPDHAWNRRRDITFIMEKLYELVAEQVDWLAAKQAA